MHLSLVLPCFNEAPNLPEVFAQISKWIVDTHGDVEVIAVNDGSSDNTAMVLQQLQEQYPWLTVVAHDVNKGYGVAVRSGLDAGSHDVLAFMDSDRQFRPEDLSLLLPKLQEVDFVAGRRKKRADPLIRNLFGKILGIIAFVFFGLWVRDINCGMKVFRKKIWKDIRPEYGVEKLFNTELFLRLKKKGIAWKQVDVPHYPRQAGNPTGASLHVIIRMFREIADLHRALR